MGMVDHRRVVSVLDLVSESDVELSWKLRSSGPTNLRRVRAGEAQGYHSR
jgi:hypothetical protein